MRIQKYTGLACPDNPARVADYGTMPWERDAEPETISAHEALLAVAKAIADNGCAYGLSAGAWVEQIQNLDCAESRDFTLAAMLPAAYPVQAHVAQDRIRDLCERIANEYDGEEE